MLAGGAAVAFGVSGGKDSIAGAIATWAHLDAIGHTGPRVLIHSDLGRVEWKDSLPTCERLAALLGAELVVVRREAGDMMDRWLTRWRNNVARYESLSCVKLILPWSTPGMRFCTSELKTAIICRELVRRFPGRAIVSCSGIRRSESSQRSKAPIAKVNAKLTSRKHATHGVDWHPIADWLEADVFARMAASSFAPHEAYDLGMTRVSCAFCIMSSAGDLVTSASCEQNRAIYLEMVDLEIASTFAFQGAKWLGDVAPHLLGDERREALARAKAAAAVRQAAEARIPAHLLYVKGWPTCVPTLAEAELLCDVRRTVVAAVGLTCATCLTPAELVARYTELVAQREARGDADDEDFS